MQNNIVDSKDEGQRLDKYIKKMFPNAPVSLLYKMLRKKNITLNNKKADGSEIISGGDAIKTFFSDETYEKFRGKPEKPFTKEVIKNSNYISLEIIYENEDVLFFNKPAGVLSQSDDKNIFSVNSYLLSYLSKNNKSLKDENYKPSICNRLDRNTSGIIMCAKTYRGARFLDDCIKNHRLIKEYYAICHGHLTGSDTLKGYLSKDRENNIVTVSKNSNGYDSYIETKYEALESRPEYSLIRVNLITGKSHQIRAHMASINHPLAGDKKYGGKVYGKIPYQMLHSKSVTFPKLTDENEINMFSDLSGKCFEASLPDYFKLT